MLERGHKLKRNEQREEEDPLKRGSDGDNRRRREGKGQWDEFEWEEAVEIEENGWDDDDDEAHRGMKHQTLFSESRSGKNERKRKRSGGGIPKSWCSWWGHYWWDLRISRSRLPTIGIKVFIYTARLLQPRSTETEKSFVQNWKTQRKETFLRAFWLSAVVRSVPC